ncbi:HesA/MoeB/ThiF family protein [Phaeobacter sp. B1627]|nr:HesA/MoeB/ThiF family protein [Phaeobacter sp. B1627]TNJ40583.1 HesA/MoeB/ThiF family protein [Phaeobacter sp. B1627]
MSPFSRQIALPEVGRAGQARLAAAHVLVVGAGGLGCPVLTYLATAGLGQITVMDPDRVELSNLHRQPLFTPRDVGAMKVEAAGVRLRSQTPGLRLTLHATALGAANAAPAIAPVDIVVDAADSFAVSYILSDACLAADKPLISASALGVAGYVGGFCGGAPSLRAVFPDLPEQAATCSDAGVLGPLVGMIGAAEAQMVLQHLLGTTPPVVGQMLSFDMGRLQVTGFRFDTAKEPEAALRFVPLGGGKDLVVDLRAATEAPQLATPRARRLSPDKVAEAGLPRDRRVILACSSGLRAWRAARRLQELGYRDLALHAVNAP